VALGTALVGGSIGAALGGELGFANQRWPVVGRLEADGSAFESEIWADRDRLGQAWRRSGYSSAVVRLESAEAFEEFERRLESDKRFELKVERESDYWEEQASATATFIRVLGLFIAFVFGIGAVLGAMITMFAQVSARIRELGVMRAIGFSRSSVLGGVMLESLLLGTAGGLLGSLGATAMRWVRIETLNFATFSQVRFGFEPTPGILLASVLFGAAMGLAGGVLPALKAARLEILEAVRA
jgi:ABC-type antimicrobial peptide transport system permease subunit